MKGWDWLVTSFTFAGIEFQLIASRDFLHQVVLQGYPKRSQGETETQQGAWA